ncbi:nucleotidyltransferase domain-containing protein [Myxococcota bacterium]|nr:nucleotidyltransferase domain-containing protein [Myxococcota bacterium]
MALRLGALQSIDPLSVPLPNGTEVTTRVDRELGDRRVPQGALGRVLASDAGRVTVKIVGVGPVVYTREELVPRKLGQLAFAARRAASFDALGPCVVLETTVGSTAWGLADASSDVDRRGVFALPFPWTTGLFAPPEDLVGADASTSYWEVKKVIRLGLRADPNTLETLFLGSATARDPIGAWILEARDAFVSKEIYASFGRYALSQLAKLSQSLRLAEHRALVLDWLTREPALELDTLAERLARAAVRDATSERDAFLRAKEYVKQLYRSLHDQGIIPAADLASLRALAASGRAAELDLPRELRPKNAYNLLRLIKSATDWLRTGEPHFRVEGAFKDELLAIKRGQRPLDEVLRAAEALTPELEAARRATKLPDAADLARADQLHRRIQEELARRFVTAAPGPFGRDAPEPPAIPDEREEP